MSCFFFPAKNASSFDASGTKVMRLNLLVMLLFVGFAAFHTSHAQNTPPDYLASHNSIRSSVGVGPMVWNTTLVTYAQNYTSYLANTICDLVHSDGPYGENLFWGSWDGYNASDAVLGWVSERKYYHYKSNSCSAPAGEYCGHYTQVVWRDSVKVGCARAVCPGSKGVVISCNYDPPGNYVGQRPY